MCFLMWLFFFVWKGVVGIFGGMDKNFRRCRYPFYKLKSYKYKLSQVTLLHTSLKRFAEFVKMRIALVEKNKYPLVTGLLE